MSDQSNASAEYPGGHIKFLFDMHVDHDANIPCDIPNARVLDVVLAKELPSDKYDATWSLTISVGANAGIHDVDQIGTSTKEAILDIISLVLGVSVKNVRLVGHGLTPRPGESGIGHLIMPAVQFAGQGHGTGLSLSPQNIHDIKNTLKAHWGVQNGSVGLFRHAITTDDSVLQFLILYLILYDIHRNQRKVDEFIMRLEPTTPHSPSPFTGERETIYPGGHPNSPSDGHFKIPHLNA